MWIILNINKYNIINTKFFSSFWNFKYYKQDGNMCHVRSHTKICETKTKANI